MKYFLPILSRYSAVLVQFLVAALVTNNLPISEAGVYFLVTGMILSSYFVVGFGLPDGAVRIVPPLLEEGRTQEANTILGATLTLGLISSVLGAFVFGAAWGWVRGTPEFGLISGLWWFGYGLMFVGSQILIALGNIRLGTFAFYSAINFCLLIVVGPLAFFSENLSLELITTGASAASVFAAGCITFSVVSKGVRPNFDFLIAQTSCKTGGTMAAVRVAQAVMIWSPVWLAGLLSGPQAAAHIGLASRLTSTIAAVLAVVRFSIRPELARHAAAGRWCQIKATASTIAFWTTMLAFVALVLDFLIGRIIIEWIFGESYGPVYALVAVFLIGTLGESMGGPVDEVLKMDGQALPVFQIQLFCLAIGGFVQLVGGWSFGVFGISGGYAMTFLGFYGALIIYLWYKRGIWVYPRPPLRKEVA